MLNLGVANNSDTFTTLIRAALYKDKHAGDDYLNNTPATVFRITPNESTKLDPYSYPEIRVRGTGKTEFDLMDDLEQLREAILKKYSGLNARELPTSIANTVGSDGIQRGIDGAGNSHDCCYLWSANQTADLPTPPFFNTSGFYPFIRNSQVTLSNDPNDFIIVYCVNHVATEVPTGPGAYGIRLDQPLFITWRSYLEATTKTGPSYSEIVYDRTMKFSPKK
jgi:hypothetical protein